MSESACRAAAMVLIWVSGSESSPTKLGYHFTVERGRETLAALFEADVALLLLSAQHLPGAKVVEELPGALAGHDLGLAHMSDGAQFLELVGA